MLPGASGYEKQRVGALMKLALSHRRVINAERKYPLVNVCVYHFPRFKDSRCFSVLHLQSVNYSSKVSK